MIIKSGKIKRVSNSSNIFATTIQILIHMKPLIEKQFDNFFNNPNSEIIPAIIDVYEQLKSGQEYLDISPFIHAIKNNFELNDIDFSSFFSFILQKIYDNEEIDDKNCLQRKICFTSLIYSGSQNKQILESNVFDILLEKNPNLKEIIKNQYEFHYVVSTKPYFLFFHPINHIDNLLIDESLFISRCEYSLSIIVVKKVDDHNYVLFIFSNKWFQMEDENIKMFENKEDAFKEITDRKKYHIELFGYYYKTDNHIVDINLSYPSKFEKNDLNNFKAIPYTVTINNFDFSSYQSSEIKTEKFDNIYERDKYLEFCAKKYASENIFYDSGASFGIKRTFNENDYNITVYHTNDSKNTEYERPIQVLIGKYEENLLTISEEKEKATKAFFRSTTTIKELFDYSHDFSEKPNMLYLIDESGDPPYQKLQNDDRPLSIFSNNTIFILFIPSKINDTFDEKNLIFSKPNSIFEKEDILTIKHSLRSLLYANPDKNFMIRKFYPKSKSKLTIVNLIENQKMIQNPRDSTILAYYINDYKKNFKVDFFNINETKISDLPDTINIQLGIAKDRNKDKDQFLFFICEIIDISDKGSIYFDPNEEGFSFAIRFSKNNSYTLESIKKSIRDYLILKNLFESNVEDECYSPSIYKFKDESLVEITDIKQLKEDNENRPIFFSWKSKTTYDMVFKMIKDHIKSSAAPIKI